MGNLLCTHISSLFTSTRYDISMLDQLPIMPISYQDYNTLVAPFDIIEFRSALWKLSPGKDPGWDGLSIGFYKVPWSQIGHDLTHLIVNILHGHVPLEQYNYADIVLLPKV